MDYYTISLINTECNIQMLVFVWGLQMDMMAAMWLVCKLFNCRDYDDEKKGAG
jgi:hypothetical protein